MPTLLPLAFALGVPTPRPLPVPAAPVRVVRAWPPPGADPSRIWIEGVSSGPLGRAPDRLFERIFRQRLAAELGRDAADPTFRGIVDLARALVAERGPDVALASRGTPSTQLTSRGTPSTQLASRGAAKAARMPRAPPCLLIILVPWQKSHLLTAGCSFSK